MLYIFRRVEKKGIKMSKMKIYVIVIFLLSAVSVQAQVYSQDRSVYRNLSSGQNISPTGQKYFTGQDGVIRMYVNVWGHVARPGTHLVFDQIDFVTLLSICGGPRQGADLKSIKIIREEPDEKGNRMFELDFTKFMQTGQKDLILDIRPNDTIIIGEKTTHMLISHMNILNTVLHVVQIYYQSQYWTR